VRGGSSNAYLGGELSAYADIFDEVLGGVFCSMAWSFATSEESVDQENVAPWRAATETVDKLFCTNMVRTSIQVGDEFADLYVVTYKFYIHYPLC
jgi:hypothetical protein